MGKIRTYEIGESRLFRSDMSGMRSGKDNILFLERDAHCRGIFLPPLAAEKKGHRWGRIHLEYELAEEMVCTVWAFASEEKEGMSCQQDNGGFARRAAVFKRDGFRCGMNCEDMLLYEACGKYLWILIEVTGPGDGRLYNIRIEGTGDRFLDTFPEIYREEGGFLQRYLTVFSALYQDFQKEIDNVYQWLDPDRASAAFLYQYAEWMGMGLEGEFLEESLLRKLVRHAYALSRVKGTRSVVSMLVELVLSREAVIVERGLWKVRPGKEEKEICDRLYGSGCRDVTVLVEYDGHEWEKARLLFLLNRFKPAGVHLRLVFYGEREGSRMDSYCYMDRNAILFRPPQAHMEQERHMLQSSENSMDCGAVMG